MPIFNPQEQAFIDKVNTWLVPKSGSKEDKRTVSYLNPMSRGYDPEKWEDFKTYSLLMRRFY